MLETHCLITNGLNLFPSDKFGGCKQWSPYIGYYCHVKFYNEITHNMVGKMYIKFVTFLYILLAQAQIIL